MPHVEQHTVLIASGQDQPGILDEITKFLLEHGASIDEITTTNLRGHVSVLLLVRSDRPTLVAVQQNLPTLQSRLGLVLSLFPAIDVPDMPGHRYTLQLSGDDETGTLRKVSHLLRALGINIERVGTKSVKPGFQLTLGFMIPREMPVTNLREYLDQLLSPLKVRWELTAD